MSILQRIKRSKSLFLDVAADIRHRTYFGEGNQQSSLSLKNKMKALAVDLAVLTCAVAVIVLCVVGAVRSYNGYAYGLHEHRIDDFEKNESHFELIADAVYEYYTAKHEYNEGCVCLYVYPVNGEFHVYYEYDDPSPVKMMEFDMTESESESLRVINELFADEASDEIFRIVVWENQVSFSKTSGYAVVCRFDDETPTHVDPTSPKDVFSRKITDGWYHSIEITQE